VAIHIKKDGWEVSADTLEELKLGIQAVKEALQESPLLPRRPGRPPKQEPKNAALVAGDRLKTALTFLSAVNGRSEGIPASELSVALGLKTKREIGTPAGLLNRMLKELGFQKDSVYIRTKKVNQEKKWYPRSKITEAIAAIEQAAGKT